MTLPEQLALIRAEFATLERELRRVAKSNRRLRDRVSALTDSRDMWRTRAIQCGYSSKRSKLQEVTT